MRALFFVLALLLVGCSSEASAPPLDHNVCPRPAVRAVRVAPELAAEYIDAVSWAFSRWKTVVPDLEYAIEVSPAASEEPSLCVTSFVPYDFAAPEYEGGVFGDTRNGAVRLERRSRLEPEGRRALLLHELGHLLFAWGHTTDRTSIMYRVIQWWPALSVDDEARARVAFLGRDGAP